MERDIEDVKIEIQELKLAVFALSDSERRLAAKKESTFQKINELRRELEDLVEVLEVE